MPEINQRIVRCPADKHYYDANKYASCPHCAGGGDISVTTDPFSQGGVNAGMGKTEIPDGGAMNVGSFSKTIDPNLAPGGVTLPPIGIPNPNPINNNDKMGKTIIVDVTPTPGSTSEPPCVGWLVEVEGPNRGKDYRLHTAYNYIGRERGDIIISGDATISAERDSSIYYVSQTRKFYISHEAGKNGVLVNNVPAMGGGVEIKDHDIISIGTTKLIFQSLCGEHFAWEDSERSDVK